MVISIVADAVAPGIGPSVRLEQPARTQPQGGRRRSGAMDCGNRRPASGHYGAASRNRAVCAPRWPRKRRGGPHDRLPRSVICSILRFNVPFRPTQADIMRRGADRSARRMRPRGSGLRTRWRAPKPPLRNRPCVCVVAHACTPPSSETFFMGPLRSSILPKRGTWQACRKCSKVPTTRNQSPPSRSMKRNRGPSGAALAQELLDQTLTEKRRRGAHLSRRGSRQSGVAAGRRVIAGY